MTTLSDSVNLTDSGVLSVEKLRARDVESLRTCDELDEIWNAPKPLDFYARMRVEIQELIAEIDFSLVKTEKRGLSKPSGKPKFALCSIDEFIGSLKPTITAGPPQSKGPLTIKRAALQASVGEVKTSSRSSKATPREKPKEPAPRRPKRWIRVEDIVIEHNYILFA